MATATEETMATSGVVRSMPNPSQGYTQIIFDSPTAGPFDFIVTDLAGKPVYLERRQIFAGENTIPFDGNNLASGMYLLTFSNGQQSITEKLIIQK